MPKIKVFLVRHRQLEIEYLTIANNEKHAVDLIVEANQSTDNQWVAHYMQNDRAYRVTYNERLYYKIR